MTARTLRLILDSDAIFSRDSATVGQPASLERVPGAALMGAAAARCFVALGADAVRVFECGAVRFGDGLPLVDGAMALPTPLSWHQRKVPDKRGVNEFDLSLAARPEEQVSQRRDGWWVPAEEGAWRPVKLDRRVSMRTAIDDEGRAREGLLYGFEAVGAGNEYRVALNGDNAALVDTVVEALTRAPVRLGRSRTAEFGEARVLEAQPVEGPGLLPEPVQSDRVRVLCVSDLCLVDEATGAARLQPRPSDFGLDEPGWVVDWDRTFLRFRRYSPFNGHRRRPDLERQVVVAGSVVTLRGPGLDRAGLTRMRESLARGVGEDRSRGLGWVLVEPALLGAQNPRLEGGELRPQRAVGAGDALSLDPLHTWMVARVEEVQGRDGAWEAASRCAEANGARFHRVPRSQWGWLRAFAAEARLAGTSIPALRAQLEQQLGRGLHARTWGAPDQERTPSALLLAFLAECPPSSQAAYALELLAAGVARTLAQKDSGGSP